MMTRDLADFSKPADFSPIFERASYVRLATLFFLIQVYPLLAILLYHR